MLDAANTTFRKSMLYACPTAFFSAIAFVSAALNIEKDFRYTDDVLQVEDPPKQHLDGQGYHHQEQEHGDVIAWRAKLLVIRLEQLLPQQDRQPHNIDQHEDDAGELAKEVTGRPFEPG